PNAPTWRKFRRDRPSQKCWAEPRNWNMAGTPAARTTGGWPAEGGKSAPAGGTPRLMPRVGRQVNEIPSGPHPTRQQEVGGRRRTEAHVLHPEHEVGERPPPVGGASALGGADPPRGEH